jgi:rhamnogalacturonyl hydrolase YesR
MVGPGFGYTHPQYLAYMHHEWQITSDLLWDQREHLFFRDSSYFDKQESNSNKVFWSRGNGWVQDVARKR